MSQLIRREFVLLILLFVLTVPLFLVTRAMASMNRRMKLDVAATWYRTGVGQLESGELASAVSSLRNAVRNNSENEDYSLVLADALAAAGRRDEAVRLLLGLRERAPERGEINLELARLAAVQGRFDDAVRYYQNALYGIWSSELIISKRRDIRIELIRFLLQEQDVDRALSELFALSADTPDDDAAGHTGVGALFLEAGATRNALESFARALQAEPERVEALLGAGRSEFELRNYAQAQRYLSRAIDAGASPDRAGDLLEVSTLILSHDPLAPRLSAAQRKTRILRDIDRVSERLEVCRTGLSDAAPGGLLLDTLRVAGTAIESAVRTADIRQNPEQIETALSFVYHAEVAADQACGAGEPIDRALILIGQLHEVAAP